MGFDGRLLANINVLAAIVHSGSFARAAQALSLSPSGVSRSVSRLEASIGIRLFDRTTRAVTLTDEGRRLYEEISPLLAGIGDAVSLASGASTAVHGRLRVNVDAYFSRRILAPHLSEFLDKYPGLSLDVTVLDQLGDIVGEGFDIAVRFGQPPSSSLIARRLLETKTVTVASPKYLKKHGAPQTPADLVSHSCIQMRSSMTGLPLEWAYTRGGETASAKITSRLLVNESETLLTACLAGAGIARMKAEGVRDLIAQGLLVELLPAWTGEKFTLYALYPSRHLPPAKVRAFIEFVQQLVAAQS
ncbi:LysR family transcriptional regulator [Rouxiella silvae]|uniref:LysR family transcriptional regulator n=1 Tax=Rouxiella silvae TaxID=1646373 RepID=A0AA40X3N1_9GAMM|nr:LysR family transcriptional regulator [Rouxiella silvae]KQN46615.1 LysR family transcriptional regulator [Serratia sp. Leaf50]MBF6637958.1 LysR family transcriptional regulator [Rouxiella silvae]ORJ20787.1 LysR family transcriptional regulator [Rouxiella silvae]